MLERNKEIPDKALLYPSKMTLVATFLWTAVIGLIYLVSAGFSLLLTLEHTDASPVWPPAGIALASVLLLGYRVSPGIFVGALLANIFALGGIGLELGATTITATFTAFGNTLEAVIGAFLIRRFTADGDAFKNIRSTFVFVVFGTLLSGIISATIGVTSLCSATGTWNLYPSAWFTWWMGDVTGVVLIAPLAFLINLSIIMDRDNVTHRRGFH